MLRHTQLVILLGIFFAMRAPVPALGEDPPAATEKSPAADKWDDDARKALSESKSPWYDAKEDTVQPWKFGPPKEEPRPREPVSHRLAATESTLQSIVKLLAWGMIAFVLAALAFLLIRAFLEREAAGAAHVSVGPSGPQEADRVEALPFALHRYEDDLFAAARRHYEAGNYSEAIIYLFSHELVELDRAQCIRLAKGKTNRQYLRELASRADLRSLLGDTVDRFEQVFFGGEQLDRASFDVCWERVPRFQQLITAGVS